MKERPYLMLSGTIFAVVALGHLVRVVAGWNLLIGDWQVPGWLSMAVAILAAGLSLWAGRLASSR